MFAILGFYKFKKIINLNTKKKLLEKLFKIEKIRGSIILSNEGVNSTISFNNNQYDLIKKRKFLKIDSLKPGITGYAQINGRDEISIKEKVQLDYFYFKNKSITFDLKILLMTIYKIIYKKNISH